MNHEELTTPGLYCRSPSDFSISQALYTCPCVR